MTQRPCGRRPSQRMREGNWQKIVAKDERRRQKIVAEDERRCAKRTMTVEQCENLDADAEDHDCRCESEDAAPASAGAGPIVSPDTEEESDESGYATPTRRPSHHAESAVKERRPQRGSSASHSDVKSCGSDDDAQGVSSGYVSSGSSVSYF